MPTNPRPEDPAEGSRETVDRQLKHSEEKKELEKGKNSHGDRSPGGADKGGVGSEDSGRD